MASRIRGPRTTPRRPPRLNKPDGQSPYLHHGFHGFPRVFSRLSLLFACETLDKLSSTLVLVWPTLNIAWSEVGRQNVQAKEVNSNLPGLRFFVHCICIIKQHSHLSDMEISGTKRFIPKRFELCTTLSQPISSIVQKIFFSSFNLDCLLKKININMCSLKSRLIIDFYSGFQLSFKVTFANAFVLRNTAW